MYNTRRLKLIGKQAMYLLILIPFHVRIYNYYITRRSAVYVSRYDEKY